MRKPQRDVLGYIDAAIEFQRTRNSGRDYTRDARLLMRQRELVATCALRRHPGCFFAPTRHTSGRTEVGQHCLHAAATGDVPHLLRIIAAK